MVTPQFLPHQGGVESHVWEVARRLIHEHRFEIEVLTTNPGGLPAREILDGIRVRRVAAWPRRGDLFFSPAIYRAIRRSSVDLLHCQSYHTLVPPLALSAARNAGLPYVVTIHSGGHSSRLRTAIRPLQALLLRPLLSAANALIAVSEYEAQLFARRLRLPIESFTVIRNGADLPASATDADDTVTARPPLVVSVGRLERYKGHHRLVEALPIIRLTHPEVRLLILGQGPHASSLRRLAHRKGVSDAVDITSAPRREVQRVLRRASVVALMSEYESQGLAAFEALALGIRLVVADSSALSELVGLESVVGVDPKASAQVLARTLTEQIDAPALDRTELALPTWDECAAQLADVYREVAGAP